MCERSQTDALKKIIEEQKIAISQISHEIRNPVTLICSSLQLIEKQHPEVHSFAHWDDTMKDIRYLLRLLEEVSCYNNGARLNREPIETSPYLQHLAASFKHYETPGHQLLIHIPDSLPSLEADPVKLRQALSNIVRNGFEAISGSGSVELTACAQKDQLLIQVKDNGCGIPAEHLEKIFLPFSSEKPEGTGLGLAIASRVAEAHGGSLRVTSVPGDTVFTMALPLSATVPGAYDRG